MKQYFILAIFLVLSLAVHSQSDSAALAKMVKESGIDPTKVDTRAGYSILIQDPSGAPAIISNRFTVNIGINRWSFNGKYELVSKMSGVAGEGFQTRSGDIRFSILNAFFIKGKHALAASGEFFLPTGAPGYGNQYFSLTPAITYSYTINPGLVFAIQPQYTFQLMKDSLYPDLSVLTIRAFLAKFTKSGLFFVIEPRPVINFESGDFDLIISPIVGQALGGGFNLVFLAEIPTRKETFNTRGPIYQFGINKSFK
jgi:hypothetical protein